MKKILISVGCLFLAGYSATGMYELEKFTTKGDIYEKRSMFSDTVPDVFPENSADLIVSRLRHEAVIKFAQHQLPNNRVEWEKKRSQIKEEIIKKAGIVIDHELPLNYQETGAKKMDGYTIKNITFQTRPGVYATANLYVPDGEGPFPAILNVHGHWPTGRVHEVPQSRGPSLALNGYVCLNIDAFGSGERTTIDGEDEYHGANLGASLMNIGESLLGIQVSENMRGVDLLTSLPYVDAEKIGATGASGGGNQTMWVTAIDERIKASMPVVSVGTFESAIMRSNCVCELLIDGLTITETSGILALIAPRAVKMCNHEQDSNPTFYPAEMKRSYNNAKTIFKMLGAEDKIDYQLFDLTHGYWSENREAMLGWFDLHLKGTGAGAPKKEIPFEILPAEQLKVYPKGQRSPEIESIAGYCKRQGNLLRTKLLSTTSFNADQKKNELRELLRIHETPGLKEVHKYSKVEGWDRFALETSDNKLIPLLHRAPRNNSGEYVVILNPGGKKEIPAEILEEQSQNGLGVVLLDLSGTGEALSFDSRSHDKLAALHTLSRAELWLGKTVLGEWVKELNLVNNFLTEEFKATKINVDGTRETAIAALFASVLDGHYNNITMRNAPVSYLFDKREGLNYFSMGIHLPKFLQWGDVSMAVALSGKNIEFIDPVTMSGNSVSDENMKIYNAEFTKLQAALGKSGQKLINR